MKMMKWALLGGAAVAVTATAARADDLSALKAQIEQLQSRVSQLEAQPQASMPSGYSLLSIRDGQGTYEGVLPERYADRVREESGFTLSVVPTADAAPAAEVSVSGEIRTALVYSDFDSTDDDNLDVKVRGRIFIKGKADTAVGEVGGYFRLQADGGGNFSDYSEGTKMNKAYGWWKFAPEWELMAGYNDNTAALQVGWDWLAASGPVSSFGPSNINNEQMRLTYSSGPLSFAIAVEDPDAEVGQTLDLGPTTAPGDDVLTAASSADRGDIPAVEAYLMYSSDAFTAQLVGLYQTDDFGDDDDWAIGGGATVGLGEMFQLTAGAVVGQGTGQYENNIGPISADEDFWGASVGLLANLSEDTRLELGVGYEDYDNAGNALGFGGGVYWDPVSQVTLGIGATYIERSDRQTLVLVPDPDGAGAGEASLDFADQDDNDSLEVFFGTWLRFP
jgi:hypothetical protein